MSDTVPDLTTVEGIEKLMASSDNHEEWLRNCEKVKAANNPQTPTYGVGDVLFTTRGITSKRNWVCESISKGFAILTELQWSTDLELEKGCCRRTQLSLRRKIKNGLPYCAKLGEFKRRDDIVVLPTTTKP